MCVLRVTFGARTLRFWELSDRVRLHFIAAAHTVPKFPDGRQTDRQADRPVSSHTALTLTNSDNLTIISGV